MFSVVTWNWDYFYRYVRSIGTHFVYSRFFLFTLHMLPAFEAVLFDWDRHVCDLVFPFENINTECNFNISLWVRRTFNSDVFASEYETVCNFPSTFWLIKFNTPSLTGSSTWMDTPCWSLLVAYSYNTRFYYFWSIEMATIFYCLGGYSLLIL